MKWLSGRCGTVLGFVTLSAVFAGVLSMVPATGHAAGRTDGARREAAVAVAKPRAAAPRDASVATRSAGCNEALDALSLCKLPTARRSDVDGAAADRRASDPSSVLAMPRAIVAAPGASVAAPSVAVEAPAHLLPVFAFGLALAGLLLGWLGFRAITSSAEPVVPGRANAFRILVPKRSATASVAKERLLHYRTLPN